nr:CotH kinase family protein [Paenibacillus rubinfantis]
MKTGGGAGTNGQSDTAGERVVSAEEKKLDEEVFPKDLVVDVKITIDEADFQDMLDNASAEEFKTASVDYNGRHFDNVGIRTKGNLSLRSVVQMSDSDRYSFKLSFDEYVNQTLDGIQKINLNNNYSDATSMREFLTYELAEQMGLPTPKYSYVNVYVNGELWGFYLAVEQIGDAYLERHFGNAYGALYKGEMTGSGSDLTWLGDDPSAYTGLAQKSETTNGDILIDMLDELNNGSDYEKYINVPDALGYIALNVLTNNMDSYLGSNKQNYYLYEDDGVFSILPWDYNMAFGGMGGGMGGMGRGGGFGRGANAAALEQRLQPQAAAARPCLPASPCWCCWVSPPLLLSSAANGSKSKMYLIFRIEYRRNGPKSEMYSVFHTDFGPTSLFRVNVYEISYTFR